jgi:hypothetical protein
MAISGLYRIRVCRKTGLNGWVVYEDTIMNAKKTIDRYSDDIYDVRVYNSKTKKLLFHKQATKGWIE